MSASTKGLLVLLAFAISLTNVAADTCSPVAFNSDGAQACPFNVSANIGVCPDAQAGQQCFSGDQCSTSANTSAACPAANDGGSCPYLPTGATCTGAAGFCSTGQLCNAQLTSSTAYNSKRSRRAGVCVTPVAAGSACTVGVDLCSAPLNFAAMYCPSSGTCPAGRPGVTCSSGDLCSTGASGTTACPANGRTSGTCPAVATGGACLQRDQCTGYQTCSGTGATAGTCVTPKTAGASCTSGTDYCVNTKLTPILGGALTAQPCPSTSVCPLAFAGSTCWSGDLCSSGSGSGTACNAASGQTSFCPALSKDAACYAGDRFAPIGPGPQQFCNGVGTTEGYGINATAAGEYCMPSEDVCSPRGAFCPSSGVCPKADSGGYCYNGDLCSSTGSVCVLRPNSIVGTCPLLQTGQACTVNDTCVFGAYCTGAKSDGTASGNCTSIYPSVTVSAAAPATSVQNSTQTPASTNTQNATATGQTFSNATTVPAVISVASLSGYATVAAFNSTEQDRFVTTMEANIYAKIDAIVNVTITNVAAGSIKVTNSVAFTSSNSAAALAGQSALASVLNSGDVSDIFGTSFGTVTVTGVALGTASNPTAKSGAVPVSVTVYTLGAAMLLAVLGLAA